MGYKYFIKAGLLFAFTILVSDTLNAQDNDSLIQKRIRAQQYNFAPLSFSTSAVTMPITTRDFELRVTNDSIIAILPFIGQSYTPQFGGVPEDGGIKFTSVDFEYSAVAKKKGKWEITIKPKDNRGIQLFLVVFSNGDAQMDVTSPRRETVLLKGYVW